MSCGGDSESACDLKGVLRPGKIVPIHANNQAFTRVSHGSTDIKSHSGRTVSRTFSEYRKPQMAPNIVPVTENDLCIQAETPGLLPGLFDPAFDRISVT